MPLKFKISQSYVSGRYGFSNKSHSIDKGLFDEILRLKIFNLTKEKPDEFDRLQNEAVEIVYTQKKPLTVDGICFKIEGKE